MRSSLININYINLLIRANNTCAIGEQTGGKIRRKEEAIKQKTIVSVSRVLTFQNLLT